MKSSEGKLWRSRGGAEEEDDYMHKIMMKWNMNQDKTMSYILFKRYVAADGHHR